VNKRRLGIKNRPWSHRKAEVGLGDYPARRTESRRLQGEISHDLG